MRTRRRRRQSNVDIGLAPFVDVVFLLLCFFVVTTSFENFQNIKVELPETIADLQEEEHEFIEMTIDRGGTVFIGTTALDDNSNETITSILYDFPKDTPLLIKADKNTRHGEVVRIMDLATQIGFAKINIAAIVAKSQ